MTLMVADMSAVGTNCVQTSLSPVVHQDTTSQTDLGGRMGAKYSWEPDPLLALMVGVVIAIIVLIPAVCSVCFHLHLKQAEREGKV